MRALRAARPDNPGPARTLGDVHASAGRPFTALWAYSFALSDSPETTDPETAVRLARALAAALFPGEAIERLRAVTAREPSHLEAVRQLAKLYLRTGQPEAALSVLEKAGEGFRAAREGAVLEGRVRQALGDASGAERAYRRALLADPDDPVPWRRLGLLLLSQRQSAEARKALERAHSLDPTDPPTMVDLARALTEQGGEEALRQAMRLYRQAVARRPYAPAYYYSSLLLLDRSQWELAAEGFARAIAADRDYAPAYRELARVLERLGRRAEAHYHKGLYYSVKDLRALSAREYLAMARADPASPGGLLMASQAHYKMTQKAQATERAREAYRRDPSSRQARAQLAALLMATHNRKEAARLCEEWLRDEPDASQPRWMLGRIAAAERRFPEAIASLEQALEREPDNVDFLESLGYVLLEMPGEEPLPRAIETFCRMAQLAPANAAARHQLGLALMRQGRLEEAQRQLLRSLDLDPHRGEVYNVLVQLCRRLKQPAAVLLFGPAVRDVEERLREELLLYRRTWDQPEDAEGFMGLARFLLRHGDLRRAESQLERAAALRPNWPQAQTELARVRRLISVEADEQ